MKALFSSFLGTSRYWWVVLTVGILMVVSGFAYWFWPVAGYAVASVLFGWMLILAGIVQLLVASGPDRGRGWGGWIAGGVVDMFIGFMLVRNVLLAESVFPYFIALIFAFWGINALCNGVAASGSKYWWMYLVNGVLMLVISYFFIEAGWIQNMEMVSFLTSLAFIYWGFTVSALAYEIKPGNRLTDDDGK